MKHFLFIYIFLSLQIFSQERSIETIYNYIVSINNSVDAPSQKTIKCGMHDIYRVKNNINKFSFEQQRLLKPYLNRPDRSNTIVSPAGYFRIHYDVTGTDAPAYNINDLAAAFDSSYNFEVNYLGFPPPPPDNNKGGDNLYDIYISDLGSNGSGYYGYTEFEDLISNGRYTSYIVMDNDYKGYYSSGINGARVTAAHELHHAIQVGNYIYRESDQTFYEVTSTSMEEFVYDNINDYYAYLPDYFNVPDKYFYDYDGYELGVWNIYLFERYKNLNFIKRQWQLMLQHRALKAIDISLNELGSSFLSDYNIFGIWSNYVNNKSIQHSFFSEAINYPPLRKSQVVSFSVPYTFNISSQAAANRFIWFVNSVNKDTLLSIFTNGDLQAAIDSSGVNRNITYSISGTPGSNKIKLSEDYYVSYNSSMPVYWNASEILNNLIVHADSSVNPPTGEESDSEYAFPNPYYYNKYYASGNMIFFTVPDKLFEDADLAIYSIDMQEQYKGTLQIVPFQYNNKLKVLCWKPEDNFGNKLSSGVYIYFIKSANAEVHGKLVIFND